MFTVSVYWLSLSRNVPEELLHYTQRQHWHLMVAALAKLKFYMRVFLCDGQGPVRQVILYVERYYLHIPVCKFMDFHGEWICF